MASSEDDVGSPPDDRIEPGSPTLEGVIFVLLGIAATVAVIIHLMDLFGAF